jgi:hypothetical protein
MIERGTKVYLAGPMSGIVGLNYPAFKAAARVLREELGLFVCNPAELAPPVQTADPGEYRVYLMPDLQWIASHAQALVVLPGWQRSTGVKVEVALAKSMGLPIYGYVGGPLPLIGPLDISVTLHVLDALGRTMDGYPHSVAEQHYASLAEAVKQGPGPVVRLDAVSPALGSPYGKTDAVEDRKTFVVPEGFEAIRDSEGRATGALRYIGGDDAADEPDIIPPARGPLPEWG